MGETIDEFLEQEKLKKEVTVKLIGEDGRTKIISLTTLLDKYNKFLKKKSYLK